MAMPRVPEAFFNAMWRVPSMPAKPFFSSCVATLRKLNVL